MVSALWYDVLIIAGTMVPALWHQYWCQHLVSLAALAEKREVVN